MLSFHANRTEPIGIRERKISSDSQAPARSYTRDRSQIAPPSLIRLLLQPKRDFCRTDGTLRESRCWVCCGLALSSRAAAADGAQGLPPLRAGARSLACCACARVCACVRACLRVEESARVRARTVARARGRACVCACVCERLHDSSSRHLRGTLGVGVRARRMQRTAGAVDSTARSWLT